MTAEAEANSGGGGTGGTHTTTTAANLFDDNDLAAMGATVRHIVL